jgi:hypothetical protein
LLTCAVMTAGCSSVARTTALTAPPVKATASPAAPPTTLTVAAAGDLFVPPPLTAQARADAQAAGRPGYDFHKIMAAVAPIVRDADLAICHVEQPLGPADGPFTGFPIFNAPYELATAAKDAGFDTCSTASNHTLDYGPDGVRRTLDTLDRVGLGHAGSARTAAEAATPDILEVRGVKVAQLAYTFSFNGIERPAGEPWIANLIDPAAILAEAHRARLAGAQIVILSMHWGTEYQHTPDEGQLGLARQLLASPDIDLIIGMHVHVVQPLEKIGDKWVAYGLGNLLVRFPDGSAVDTQDSVVPRFTFTRTEPGRWRVTAVEARPFFMAYVPKARLVDAGQTTADYAQAARRTTENVDLRGARAAGLTMS